MPLKLDSFARRSKTKTISVSRGWPDASLCEEDGGAAMSRLTAALSRIGQDLTGVGVQALLEPLRSHLPVTIHQVPSPLGSLHRANEEPGCMAWGECLLRGRTPSEVLISCEIGDPPWRAGDLAGLVVAIALAQRLHCTKTRYSYRLLFMPHSMGSVSWLALNQPSVARIKHSLVIDGAAGPDHPIYSESQLGGAKVDQAVAHVLRDIGGGILADEAHASGCALPGAAPAHLPASTDPGSLHEALMGLLTVIDVLESNCVYVTGSPDNRPEFTNHGLLPLLAGNAGDDYRRALVWVLNLSDGRRTLLDIADQGGFGWDTAKAAARALVTCGLIRPMTQSRAFTAERQPMNRVLN